MVAILDCGADVADRLERRAVRGQPVEYSEAWRWDKWQGLDAHLAILVDEDGAIRWLGRVQGGKGVTSRDRMVIVTEIEEIDPTALDNLRSSLPRELADIERRRGILPPAVGAAVVAGLLHLLPGYRDLVARLGRPRDTSLPAGARAELLNQQRDAVGMLLDIALGDTSRRILRTWSAPPGDAPFLSGMSDYRALEDRLVTHDVERFGSWVQIPNARVEWRTFTEGRRRIFIMDANRTPVEHTLGVDVVYYNEARDSFVLVQYKKMRHEPTAAGRSLFYRPDNNLSDELQRMQSIDELCAGKNGDFRLLATACWMKLCDPHPVVEDAASLIRGMYFAREHFLELLQSCRGPKGGTRIGYDNVPRHLNNTMFTDLVADGWIGSRGPATEEIQRLIRESLETGHAVIVGVQHD